MRGYLFVLILVSGIFFIGCGDDDDPMGPVNDGSFTITISGDISKNISGFAWFWSGSVQGESGFVLYLSNDDDIDDNYESLWFAREGSARPGTGSYLIGNYDESYGEGWNPDHFFGWYSDDDLSLWSVSGSMNVTASSSNRFAGSFQLSAIGYSAEDWENELSVTIAGEFEAIGGDFDFLPKTIYNR